VGALLQRAGPAAPPLTPIEKVRDRLADGDEDGATTAMAALSPADAAAILQRTDLRALAVKAFNDKEMARAITGLKGGRLLHKLQWLKAEDSSFKLVWPLISDPRTPAEEKTELYQHNEMRSFFVDFCDDDEMARAVDALGGPLEAKLNWMFEEGTNWEAVKVKIRAAPPEQRVLIYSKDYMRRNFESLLNDPEMSVLVGMLGGTLDQQLTWMASEGTSAGLVYPKVRIAPPDQLSSVRPDTRAAIRKELSAKEFRWFERMLDEGVLVWADLHTSATEPHYELKDESDPSKGWKLEDFDVDGRYEIIYSRTELRVRVRIRFKGCAATAAHKKIWSDGIANRWNNKFHLEGPRRLAVVFEPVWVSSDEDHTVKLHPPPIVREDAENWYVGPTANADASTPPDTTVGDTAAHEFGHLVGLPDEYRLRKADFERIVGRPATNADKDARIGYSGPAIMRWGGSDIEARHLTAFVRWLNKHALAGEGTYRLVAGPP
jgi:hypothetical protein